MLIDNIIVIAVAIILITYLSINYVKKYVPINLVIIAICAFSLGVYLPIVYYGVYFRIRYQILLFLGIFLLPCIFAILQYNNISFNKKILYNKAKKYFEKGKYNKCIDMLKKNISTSGASEEKLYLMADAYYRLEDYDKAKEILNEIIEINPNNYQAYYMLADIAEKEEDLDNAKAMYKKCIEAEPRFYDAYEELGILYANDREFEEAEKVYKDALDYHSNSYELLYNLAMIELELSKTSEAQKYLELALSIKDDIPEAIYSLANIELLRGDYIDALHLYDKIKDNDVYGLKAYYKIAIIYVTKNDFDRAMEIVRYIVNKDESYINMIENEFVFNAMRSRIDDFLRNRNRTSIQEDVSKTTSVSEEKEDNTKKKKGWFSKKNKSKKNEDTRDILYDDIDMSKTGFRQEKK